MTFEPLSFADYGKNPRAFKSDFEQYLSKYDLNCSERIMEARNDCKVRESETVMYFNNLLKKKENEIKNQEENINSQRKKMAEMERTNRVEKERLLYGKKYMKRQLKICSGEKESLGEELKGLTKALQKSMARNDGLFRQLADTLERSQNSGEENSAGIRAELEDLKRVFEESRESNNALLNQRLLEIRRLEGVNHNLSVDVENLSKNQQKLIDGFNDEKRSLGLDIEKCTQLIRDRDMEINSAKEKNDHLKNDIHRINEMYEGCIQENEKLLSENEEYYNDNRQLKHRLNEMKKMAGTLFVEFDHYKAENNKNITDHKVKFLEEEIKKQRSEIENAQEEITRTFRLIKVAEDREKGIGAEEKKKLEEKIAGLEKTISKNELDIDQKDEKLQRCVNKHIKFLREIKEKRKPTG